MTLLERARPLQELNDLLAEAVSRHGQFVFLGAEAGGGKTTLIQQFCHTAASTVRVVTGACDPLSTPRPLGPLLDMAGALGKPDPWQSFPFPSRDGLFQMLLANLAAHERPTLMIIEDVHWADEATLDLLRFLGRRIGPTRVLLLVTYRHEEVGTKHPLRTVLGDLATSGVIRRMTLTPLSVQAVAQLAGSSRLDAARLHQQTGGNPFFVTEILSAGGEGEAIPMTVRDAVLARVARLSPAGRAVLEAASVIGVYAEVWLLTLLTGAEVQAVEECLDGGMLLAQGTGVAFRHELARQAVLDSVSPHRQQHFHTRLLAALTTSSEQDVARLAHHAEGANDAQAVLDHAPKAARRAAGLHAHREAAAQYARALRFSGNAPMLMLTSLLEAFSVECALIDRLQDAVQARHTAVRLWRAAGNQLKVGENLSSLAGLHLNAGQNAEGEAASLAALDVLSDLPEGVEHARAYQMQAHIRMLNRDHDQALEWGARALKLAEGVADLPITIGAYNTLGTSLILSGDPEQGGTLLKRSLTLARTAGLDSRVASAYSNLGSGYGEIYRFAQADAALAEGIAFCRDRDLDAGRLYMEAWQALTHGYQGRWPDATAVAASVLQHPTAATISRIMALLALGRVRTRRGDPEVWNVLDEALELARRTATLQRLAPVYAARAEAAWLTGQLQRTALEAGAPYELALQHRHPWFVGELAYWQWKAGSEIDVPSWAAQPYVLQQRGAWAQAAEAWYALHCPYEAARALSESTDEAALKEALDTFQRLGAQPMVQWVQRRLRDLGVRGIPRGPRPATRTNPLGLTPRELEVLSLLATGHSDKQIARHLTLSSKTVGHHVSAILGKLGTKSRAEAAAEALRRKMIELK
ncbi:helix-turn-helix transcriptional regulator [Deinococcus ruber]|uniref:LuxR family transcriptional regulator n=1 Tax=Deinococcus ruber TaxID=1848197 RepID=A0A918F7A0_9DEIO|nr:LuxR C-terminal-related transcriptional regulator [Deinococcus ruber]GGR15415.1 LuxR family transcriptional regulator [Deinococcus ruber]